MNGKVTAELFVLKGFSHDGSSKQAENQCGGISRESGSNVFQR